MKGSVSDRKIQESPSSKEQFASAKPERPTQVQIMLCMALVKGAGEQTLTHRSLIEGSLAMSALSAHRVTNLQRSQVPKCGNGRGSKFKYLLKNQ